MAEEEAKGSEIPPAEGDDLEAGYQAAEQDEDSVDVVDASADTELGEEDLPEPESFEADDEEAEELEGDSAATPSPAVPAKVSEKKNRPTRTRAEATALDAPKKTTLGTFISQVVQELKKVVWPSSGQLWQYFAVVLIFVLVIIAFIGVLDYLFGLLVMWLFK